MRAPTLPESWERRPSTPEGRWARLGPYYAMFPISFAQEAVEMFTTAGDVVADPFCGRGTAPYVAMVNGRQAIGCEINPVAWIYSATKTSPAKDSISVKRRVSEIAESVSHFDCIPETEFQALAFCRRVLGFVNAARRELRWYEDTIDQTVAAFLIHYLHTKIPQGLSNQMRHCRAMSPNYCVRWWRANGYDAPPEVDPVKFLHSRIGWRYQKGFPAGCHNGMVRIALGDSATHLPDVSLPIRLVVTSPPYSAVTDYRADSWLRLWALGEGPALPVWSNKQRYVNLKAYHRMVKSVFEATAERADSECVWLIRSDARDRTLSVIREALAGIALGRCVYSRAAPFSKSTQTALYGDSSRKPGEIDLLLLPHGSTAPDGWDRSQHVLTA